MAPEQTRHRLVEQIRQSAPVDTSAAYDPAGVAGKTILITGAAAGFGAAFARHWARHGAFLMLGDIDDAGGEALAAELRAATGCDHHHFQHCDVTDWQSQAAFFRAAARLSPTGGIDAVVANAGVADRETTATGRGFENPADLDVDHPPPPSLAVMDVNLTGVMHTAHLALFWLGRDGAAKENGNGHHGHHHHGHGGANGHAAPPPPRRDGHLLLVGSMSSFMPLAGTVQYTAAKHGVMGLFRALRSTAWLRGVRVNMLCPYFVDTGILPKAALLLLAGGAMARVPDVVDAGTRLMADAAIAGRALVVGPPMTVVDGADGETRLVAAAGGAQAVWECYAHDYDSVELFVYRYTRLLNAIVAVRGWIGWWADVVWILLFRRDKRR